MSMQERLRMVIPVVCTIADIPTVKWFSALACVFPHIITHPQNLLLSIGISFRDLSYTLCKALIHDGKPAWLYCSMFG